MSVVLEMLGSRRTSLACRCLGRELCLWYTGESPTRTTFSCVWKAVPSSWRVCHWELGPNV